MAQRKGLHTILEIPFFYNLVQRLFNRKEAYDVWYELVGNPSNKVVLDVGCGPGTETNHFKNSRKYIGVDISKIYIEEAKKNHPDAGEFYCCSIEEISQLPVEGIDIITIKGVFHHLPDDLIRNFLNNILKKMNKGGRIITLDCAFKKGNFFTNLVVGMDRGKYVRSINGYKELIPEGLELESDHLVSQYFPPYLRYYMNIKKV